MLTTDTVLHVIRLGTAIEDYWDGGGVLKHLPTYPLLGPDGKEPPHPPEEEELRSYLRSLPSEDVYDLLAAVKLAWDNFPVAEFDTQLTNLKAEVRLPDAIERLVRTTYLTADLLDGLNTRPHPGVDVRALQLTAA